MRLGGLFLRCFVRWFGRSLSNRWGQVTVQYVLAGARRDVMTTVVHARARQRNRSPTRPDRVRQVVVPRHADRDRDPRRARRSPAVVASSLGAVDK